MSSLVIKKWFIKKDWQGSLASVPKDEVLVEIQGRDPGALSWFLSLVGINVTVVEVAGIDSGISFKWSVIENQKIDEKQAGEVIGLIKTLIDGQ